MRSFAIWAAALVLFRSLLVLTLGDAFFYGEELEKATAAPSAGDHEAENKELKEARTQLAASNAKLHEQRLQMQASQAELQKYQRALAKEVGDDVVVAKLLEEGSNAKGRAQQILMRRSEEALEVHPLQAIWLNPALVFYCSRKMCGPATKYVATP